MPSTQKLTVALLVLIVLIVLISGVNLGMTALGISSAVEQPMPTLDLPKDSAINTPSEPVEAAQAAPIEVAGRVLTGDQFTLTVPEEFVIIPQGSMVRLQSYDRALDEMPAGGFFLYISQGVEDDRYMATSRVTTMNLEYLGKEAVRGDGCGIFSGPCNGVVRGYYFVREGVAVDIFSNSSAGRAAAEEVIRGMDWKE